MYGEDVDLGWRVWAAGGSVVVAADAWALHVGGTAAATRCCERRPYATAARSADQPSSASARPSTRLRLYRTTRRYG